LKFVLYGGSFLAFGLIFSRVGYSLTLAAFLLFVLKVVEKQTWKITLSVTIASVIGSYIVFQIFFGIPLPEGVLTPVTQLLR
jgi:vacuolar-type H+-ATPase subunit I/STV1